MNHTISNDFVGKHINISHFEENLTFRARPEASTVRMGGGKWRRRPRQGARNVGLFKPAQTVLPGDIVAGTFPPQKSLWDFEMLRISGKCVGGLSR